MKALKVFESLDFERGKDPIDVMDLGIKSWLQNFGMNYFRLGLNGERGEAQEKFNKIMSTIKFEEIPVDTKYFPLELIFGYKENDRKYKQFKLDYDLYLSCKNYLSPPEVYSGYLTDEKGNPIANSFPSSVGKQGIETLLNRINIKHP
jgi:hypothetical protein